MNCIPRIDNEEKLLIRFAREELETEDIEQILDILEGDINWEKLFEIMSYHGVIGILSYHIDKLLALNTNLKIPLNIRTKALVINKIAEFRTKKQLEELEKLNEIFCANGIKFVVLKGPALQKTVYKRSGVRTFGDFDLLFDTKDIENAHKLLLQCGYCKTNKLPGIITNGKSDTIKIAQYTHHLFEYEKVDNGFKFYVEMHHTYNKDSRLDFTELYKQSTQNGKNIHIPNLLDLFIHSCKHAWKHYPSNMATLKQGATRIIQFMDIRESFLEIQNNNQIDLLVARIKELQNLGVIHDALMLTKKIYGRFDNIEALLLNNSKYQYDWQSSYFISYFEDRMFRPYLEYERLCVLYNQAKIDEITEDIIECQKVVDYDKLSSCKNIWGSGPEYAYNSQDTYSENFWGNFINYQQGSFHGKKIYFSFSTSWDESNFYLKLDVENIVCWFIDDNEIFNPYESYLSFSFGKEPKDHPLHFFIQLRKNMKHLILRTKSLFAEAEEIDDANLETLIHEKYIRLHIAIPWKNINIEPSKDKKVLFQLAIRVADGANNQVIVWNSGKGQNYNDCTLHSTMLLR